MTSTLKQQSIATVPRLISAIVLAFSIPFFGQRYIPAEYLVLAPLVSMFLMAGVVICVVLTINYILVDVKGYRLDTGPGRERYMISKSPFAHLIIREFIK